jgi:hypothetical protein
VPRAGTSVDNRLAPTLPSVAPENLLRFAAQVASLETLSAITPRRIPVKYLCLAYGDGADWEMLSESERAELLANDEALRERGDFVTALEPTGTVVKAWDGVPQRSSIPFAKSERPLVGFSIIEAENMDEVVNLVANTPCARAKGAIEIRPLLA